ncbi:MAG: hypothetical protein NXI12_12125 [Alphaproteobacteria bacterium]|nr:hypothetical protein [Alphaproteobacteria bacterium]
MATAFLPALDAAFNSLILRLNPHLKGGKVQKAQAFLAHILPESDVPETSQMRKVRSRFSGLGSQETGWRLAKSLSPDEWMGKYIVLLHRASMIESDQLSLAQVDRLRLSLNADQPPTSDEIALAVEALRDGIWPREHDIEPVTHVVMYAATSQNVRSERFTDGTPVKLAFGLIFLEAVEGSEGDFNVLKTFVFNVLQDGRLLSRGRLLSDILLCTRRAIAMNYSFTRHDGAIENKVVGDTYRGLFFAHADSRTPLHPSGQRYEGNFFFAEYGASQRRFGEAPESLYAGEAGQVFIEKIPMTAFWQLAGLQPQSIQKMSSEFVQERLLEGRCVTDLGAGL